ncbi:MAG: DUF373 family protein [Candidatus Methanomethyliaceae archaeon]|nr:DUF373 family protein [Candidatus Methanomethyliaceae archaeon]MDW7971188.1 DUF373 family protein [Nitrososphaerota archaeon]
MKNRILILGVDKDDDIGRITGISTPIVGKDAVLSAAIQFAMKSPEDSDANSIFAALSIYDTLVKEGQMCEIAIITGLPGGGYKSDLKISSELDEILKYFKADGVIFVSDGVSDEQVIPIVQSKVPIISIKRIFVQQERSVEETYVLLYRYFKKLTDPEYSKIALGVPGVAIFAIIVLYLLNLLSYVVILLGLIFSSILIIKGFSIDRMIKSAWSESPIKLITSIIGVIISVIAIYRGAGIAIIEIPISGETLNLFAASMLSNTIDLLALGIGVYVVGRLVVKYLDEDPKIWHEMVSIVVLIFIRQIVMEASLIIKDPKVSLIPFLLASGLGVLVCGFLVIVFSIKPLFFRKKIKKD